MNTTFSPVSLQLAQPVRFSNRFGTVEITPVTEFMPVSGIQKTHTQAQENTFDLTTAEKIALITENRGIQLCPHFPIDGWLILCCTIPLQWPQFVGSTLRTSCAPHRLQR